MELFLLGVKAEREEKNSDFLTVAVALLGCVHMGAEASWYPGCLGAGACQIKEV